MGRDRIICANVGDSRAVLCRAGEAVDLTAEHRVYGRSAGVLAEVERVEAAGGWVHDGRVCGILGVARAFGDRLFKAPGLPELLDKGVADGFWDATFAAAQRFSSSLVTAVPEVTELPLQVGRPPARAHPSAWLVRRPAPAGNAARRCAGAVRAQLPCKKGPWRAVPAQCCAPQPPPHLTHPPLSPPKKHSQTSSPTCATQEADEFVVLATDGLWDVIGSQEVARLTRRELGRGLAPQEVAVKLCDFALKRYTADNVAVVVVELRQQAGGGSATAGGKKGGGGLFGLFGR